MSLRGRAIVCNGLITAVIKLGLSVAFAMPLLVFSEDQYEPNNSRDTATQLLVGDPTPQVHTLNPDQDVDWFRFNARFNEIYDIRTLDVGTSVDLVIEVYDGDGEQIGESEDAFFEGEAEELSFRAPETGAYYLKIYDYACINETTGCSAPRGENAKYSIVIFVPTGAVGGTDLSIAHQSDAEAVLGSTFPLGVTITNNGGQEEDDTADNLLILTYSEPKLAAPSDLPEGCAPGRGADSTGVFVDQPGLIICEKDQLVAEESHSYTLNFEFTEVGNVRFTSSVAGFENADYSLQQPDDIWSNNIIDEVIAVGEGGGSGPIDSDEDGVVDGEDNCPLVANAIQLDTDEDGVGDACDDDDDNDGFADEEDVCPLVTNPNQTDTDLDGEGDACDDDDDGDSVSDDLDNCPLISNVDQDDSDGDGKGDVCDASNDQDTDGDSILDAIDNCLNVKNTDQSNLDGDEFGDLCDDDIDGDAVKNGSDNCPATPNDQLDVDGDGIGDACDDAPNDFDNDGSDDEVDNCPLVANAGQVDTDGDDIGDACDDAPNDFDNDGSDDEVDNCPLVPNADQVDTDGDDKGDACDDVPNDFDNDGADDELDNCPLVANADQVDTDGDGIGDACDDAPNDEDSDGIADDQDNCRLVANADQADADGDGIGDACDDAPNDQDDDGINDDLDNCPLIVNSDQVDFDSDGVGDTCDADIDGDGVDNIDDLFPKDGRGGLDTDMDGMPDQWERLFGLDPDDETDAVSDIDGDGATALEEFLRESDPTKSDLAQQLIGFDSPAFLITDQTSKISMTYATSDGSQSVTGLTIRVFFQSSALGGELLENIEVFAGGLELNNSAAIIDVDDLDADPVTDYYHTFQWADADSNWPGEDTLPLVLLSGTVTPNESLERFVINVEPVKPGEGYEIIAESLLLNVGTVSLDIDGNGKAEPLTDGLLVIRYLFGFSGESLIQGAVAPDASRKEADEIAAAVEALVP